MRPEIIQKIAAGPDTQVQLDNCQIDDRELPDIIEEIKQRKPNAVSFFLNDNQIGEKGAIFLAEQLLSSFQNIMQLMLQNNQISEAGIEKLCELRQLPRFQVLALRGNHVKDEGKAYEIEKQAASRGRRP